jgi:hypothetical protein
MHSVREMRAAAWWLAVAGAVCVASAQLPAVQLVQTATGFTISNGFAQVAFDTLQGRVTTLQGRYNGDGAFAGMNVIPSGPTTLGVGTGIAVEVQATPAALVRSTAGWTRSAALPVTVVSQSASQATVRVSGMQDSATDPRVNVTMEFSLSQTSRSVSLSVSATVLPCHAGVAACGGGSASSYNVTSIRLGMYFTPRSGVAQLGDGLMESMDHDAEPFYATASGVERWSAVGDASQGSVDVTFPSPYAGVAALWSGRWNGARSGLCLLWAGPLPLEQWVQGWTGNLVPPFSTAPVTVSAGTTFSQTVLLAPSDLGFPIGALPVAEGVKAAGLSGPWTSGAAQAPAIDYTAPRSVLTGTYGGPMGSIVSHAFAPEGRITPCVWRDGNTCYGGTFNYFDPDSFLSIGAMAYSMDPVQWAQAVRILDTTRGLICRQNVTGVCTVGQIPHHIVDSCKDVPACVCVNNTIFQGHTDCVTFAALSGAFQTGPAIFWSLANLHVASVAGNLTRLAEVMPDVRLVVGTLLQSFDARVQLLSVGGSLMIDTFRRGNYTTDSNAALVLLLNHLAAADLALGNAAEAAAFTALAANVTAAMRSLLFVGDHFITQRNPDNSTADFVDYDANLLAVMAGVATPAQAALIFARVDAGACTHSRGTYVSEIPYLAPDCFLENTGDSAVTMGRIGWLDARARWTTGDVATALDVVLAPIQQELFTNTWVYERYTCGGQPTHNPYYIEYGEVVAMIDVEVRIGLRFTPTAIIIHPIDPTASYTLALGNQGSTPYGTVRVARTPTAVAAAFEQFPANAQRTIQLGGVADGTWTVSISPAGPAGCNGGTFSTNNASISFCAVLGPGSSFLAQLQ